MLAILSITSCKKDDPEPEDPYVPPVNVATDFAPLVGTWEYMKTCYSSGCDATDSALYIATISGDLSVEHIRLNVGDTLYMILSGANGEMDGWAGTFGVGGFFDRQTFHVEGDTAFIREVSNAANPNDTLKIDHWLRIN